MKLGPVTRHQIRQKVPKILTMTSCREDHFEVKLRSNMSSRLSEYILKQPVLKGLSWSLYLENRKDLFIYRCIKNSCFTFSKNRSN